MCDIKHENVARKHSSNDISLCTFSFTYDYGNDSFFPPFSPLSLPPHLISV